MSICVFSSYMNAFFTGRAVDVKYIGMIGACTNALSVVFQPMFSSICDRSKKPGAKNMIIIISVVSVLFALTTYIEKNSLVVMGGAFAVAAALMLSLQPLINTMGIQYMQLDKKVSYSAARGIGSFTFALFSLFLSGFAEKDSEKIIVLGISVTLIFIGIMAMQLSSDGSKVIDYKSLNKNHAGEKYDCGISNAKFFAIILSTVMIFTLYNVYNIFLLQVIIQIGQNPSLMGICFSLAAFLELPAMFMMDRVLKKFDSGTLMSFAALMMSVKGFMTYFAASSVSLLAVQFLQVFGFAVFIPSSVYYIQEHSDFSNKTAMQGYMTSAITAGAITGSLIGGALISHYSAKFTVLAASCIGVPAFLIMHFATKK